MVGNDIQFADEDIFVAEPFTDITHIAFEVQIRVAEFDARVVNRHFPIGVTELNRRNIDGLRQFLGHFQLAVLHVQFQPRVPFEQGVLTF